MVLLFSLLLSSCFKDIDTEPLPLPEVEEYIIVQHSIKAVQSFFRFYENTVVEVDTCRPSKWTWPWNRPVKEIVCFWLHISTGVPSGFSSSARSARTCPLHSIQLHWIL